MNPCQEGAGDRRAREARRSGAVVHPRAQSGQGRRWGGRGAGLRRMERRCPGAVGAAGGEMGEDCLDEFGRFDARDDAQRAATHGAVFDVDAEDALEPLHPAHGRGARRRRRAGGWVDRVGDDAVAVLEVRGEHAVVPGEMGAGAWNEGGEAGDEVDGVEHDMSGAVPEGVFEPIHDLPAVIDREAFVGDGRAGDVAAQAFEGVPVTGWAARAGMEGESRELGDAEVVGRRVGADGAQRQCLAPGVGAGGDAVVDGGAEELFETVGGFDVEGRGLVGAGQQPLLFQSAGDTGGDGVEQALEFGLCRCGDAVETGRFVIERVGAVDEEHVQVGVEVQRRAEALDEGDGASAGAGVHAQSGAAHEKGGNRPVDDAQDLGEHRGACREQEP